MSPDAAFASLNRKKRARNSQTPSPSSNSPPRTSHPSVPQFLSQRGLEQLRSIANDPLTHRNYVESYSEHRDAADIAFFAYNASLDAGPTSMDKFHHAMEEFKRNTKDPKDRARIILRLRRAVQDHAALIDQITGSTTLVVHIPGAAEPNTPASPEFVKAYSYLPGTLLREVEAEGDAERIDDVIQVIIRELGVPTIKRFERAIKKKWESIPWRIKISPSFKPRPLPDIRGMPRPIPDNSCRYLFYGRAISPGAVSTLRDIERHMRQQSLLDDKEALDAFDLTRSIWKLDEDEASQASLASSNTLDSIVRGELGLKKGVARVDDQAPR